MQRTQGKVVFERGDFDALLGTLRDRGYRVIGPRIRDDAVVYDEIDSSSDLPEGWTDEQDGGTYRLHKRDDAALFGYAVGPHSWKRFLFPPSEVLWRAHRTNGSMTVDEPAEEEIRYAFLGVRAWELRAIEIQDRVFMGGSVRDERYVARRERALFIAVNCGTPAKTCFCASMGTGPAVTGGFDIALTEIVNETAHYFLAEAGNERGVEILGAIPQRGASTDEEAAAREVTDNAATRMGRTLDAAIAPGVLASSPEAERWAAVAERCLACGNCTMVCPTCFCSTVEDTTDLTGESAERARRWDTCFSLDFSAMGGGHVRSSTRARYRQWLTHKFSTWVDQFGTSGCVGCGRCIAWCPVGIDVTQEIDAIAKEAAS
jgi:ferredoxin